MCTAIKSVPPTATDKTAPRSAVAGTVEAATIFLVNVTAPPVTPDHCEFFVFCYSCNEFPTVKLRFTRVALQFNVSREFYYIY